jgi:hydrogenase/urease accessory protein HupE
MIRWLWLALLLAAWPVQADELRPGYLEFSQKGATDWQLIWKAPMRGGLTPETRPVLPQGCGLVGQTQREMGAVAFTTTSAVRCTGDVAGRKIGLSGFGASQTDVLVRVAPLGRPVQALRLTAAAPLAEIRAKPGAWQVVRTYFGTGVAHILFGYDHLLFVVALVLLLDRLGAIVRAVTAFTVAHSITLIGTTLGFFGLPQRPVESVIALSIMFLAVEIIKKQPEAPRLSERAPWLVAFVFGLLHGFGFAGALKEIGLPESDVPMALLSFNLGVEAGQLLIVLACLVTLFAIRWLAHQYQKFIINAATYAIGTIASFWFIMRTFA